MQKLLAPREAANILGISYPTLKQWIYRGNFRKISGRNQLIGRVTAIKYSGLLAQITLAIGEQHITSIITADAAKEMRLKPGERVAALVKSTEVMILRV